MKYQNHYQHFQEFDLNTEIQIGEECDASCCNYILLFKIFSHPLRLDWHGNILITISGWLYQSNEIFILPINFRGKENIWKLRLIKKCLIKNIMVFETFKLCHIFHDIDTLSKYQRINSFPDWKQVSFHLITWMVS